MCRSVCLCILVLLLVLHTEAFVTKFSIPLTLPLDDNVTCATVEVLKNPPPSGRYRCVWSSDGLPAAIADIPNDCCTCVENTTTRIVIECTQEQLEAMLVLYTCCDYRTATLWHPQRCSVTFPYAPPLSQQQAEDEVKNKYLKYIILSAIALLLASKAASVLINLASTMKIPVSVTISWSTLQEQAQRSKLHRAYRSTGLYKRRIYSIRNSDEEKDERN